MPALRRAACSARELTRPLGPSPQLEWEWTSRCDGQLQLSNTGVPPLQPRADPEAAVFDLLCGAAQLAASAAAESARCVAAAAALREELQRTAAEAAAASAAKAATERELYTKARRLAAAFARSF